MNYCGYEKDITANCGVTYHKYSRQNVSVQLLDVMKKVKHQRCLLERHKNRRTTLTVA